MKDLEIYQLAGDVLSSITSDLNEEIYLNLNGKLSLVWSEIPTVNAWAESLAPINEPPNHKIGIHYELVRQLYRDIEAFCKYLESDLDSKAFDFWFQNLEQPIEMLPSLFSTEAQRKNMFISAITWVFFHELGHLKQEHGYIRSQFLNTKQELINECHIEKNITIEGKTAAIYHVTEMAADFEAIDSCISELIRHFSGEDLKASIYLFVCGISTILYRFHGEKSLDLDCLPRGSHPNPLTRLENVIPQIYEFLSVSELHKHIGIELKREMTVGMCNQAATAAGLFWLRCRTQQPEIPDEYFLIGNLNRTNGKAYLRTIIETWDEIEPSIKDLRRFGHYFGLLQFSEYTRNNILVLTE
ncbi:hypothetical protein [Psychromonas sp. SA13A]|uniref:hypothetical protein n=1 Tax=Psychromonas sp. SA13A TaxID=2686346 RepID=UPI00140B8950|nr:hypothetical protein [Psychromonas sp. SA13A]